MVTCCGPVAGGDVRLRAGARPAGVELMRRIGVASELMRLPLLVVSGDRSPYEAWVLRMRQLNGTGNLAALCCGNRYRHSWASCGKTPRSNHARGLAVDCGWVTGRGYRSFMLVPGAYRVAVAAGVMAPLWSPWNGRIEPWHMTLARR